MTTKTTKSKPDTKPKNLNALTLEGRTPEEQTAKGSELVTTGSANAILVRAYMPVDGVGVTDIHTAMLQQADAIKADGDRIHQAEAMLLNQAAALQAMFIDLASRAKVQTHRDYIQTLTGLALRAQSNCTNTLKVLGDLRTPRQAVFARQANIAHGHQQVNNGTSPPAFTDAPETINTHTEQSGGTHGLLPDARASGTSGRIDPHLETVGEVHRAKDRRGQGNVKV